MGPLRKEWWSDLPRVIWLMRCRADTFDARLSVTLWLHVISWDSSEHHTLDVASLFQQDDEGNSYRKQPVIVYGMNDNDSDGIVIAAIHPSQSFQPKNSSWQTILISPAIITNANKGTHHPLVPQTYLCLAPGHLSQQLNILLFLVKGLRLCMDEFNWYLEEKHHHVHLNSSEKSRYRLSFIKAGHWHNSMEIFEIALSAAHSEDDNRSRVSLATPSLDA